MIKFVICCASSVIIWFSYCMWNITHNLKKQWWPVCFIYCKTFEKSFIESKIQSYMLITYGVSVWKLHVVYIMGMEFSQFPAYPVIIHWNDIHISESISLVLVCRWKLPFIWQWAWGARICNSTPVFMGWEFFSESYIGG